MNSLPGALDAFRAGDLDLFNVSLYYQFHHLVKLMK